MKLLYWISLICIFSIIPSFAGLYSYKDVDCDLYYGKKDRIGRCNCNSLKYISVISDKCDTLERYRETVSYYGCLVDACKDVYGKNKYLTREKGKIVWTVEAQYCLDYFNYLYSYYSLGRDDFALVLYGGEVEGQYVETIHSTYNEDWYSNYIQGPVNECIN